MKPLSGSGRTRPSNPRGTPVVEVVDRLEDRADGAGRGDPRDHRGQLGLRSLGDRALVPLGVVDRHARPAVALAPGQRRVGLAVQRIAVAGEARDGADTGRERDRHAVATVSVAVEAGGQQAADDDVTSVGVGARA